MSRKSAKATQSPDIPNVELRRIELEERKIQLEERRFEYEKEKTPAGLTRRLAIGLLVAAVLSPVIGAIAGITAAKLSFESKEVELKNQKAFNETDIRFKVTSFLLNNWRDLNNRPPEEKRFFASLIADFLPQSQSIQLLDNLERTSAPATKGIWREAKAQIVNEQLPTSQACLAVEEKTAAPAQESKTPDFARLVNSTHSVSSPWADNSTASITDLLYGTTKPVGGLSGGGNTRTSIGSDYGYLTDAKFSVLPASFKEGTGIGDVYPIGQPSYLKSAGLQITTVPGTLAGSQVTVTFTEGNLSNDPYQPRTPLYVNVPGAQRLGMTVNAADLIASDISPRTGVLYPFNSAPSVNVSGAGWGIDLETGKFKVQTGMDYTTGITLTGVSRINPSDGLTLDRLGSSTLGGTTIKISAAGYASIFPETQTGNLLPVGVGTVVKEKTPPILIEAGKPRVQ